MNYSSRFFLYAPFALLLLLGAAVGVHWWSAAGALAARLDALNGRAAMPGVTLRFASRTIGGFPFRLDVVFRDFEIDVAAGHGPARWKAEQFALHGLTYGRDETIFEAAGRQSLAWTDAKGAPRTLPFEAGSLRASAIRDAGGLSRFDLDLVGFGSPALTAARIQVHIRHAPAGDALDIAAMGDLLRLSPALRGPFGDTIKRIALQAGVSRASSFDALRAGRSDWRDAAEAWRARAGLLEADPFEIDWGRLDMIGRGAVSLDAARRPQGILDFKIGGMDAWLSRNLSARPGGIADALRVRAAKAGSDEAGRLGVLIGAKGGIVYVGDQPAGLVGAVY